MSEYLVLYKGEYLQGYDYLWAEKRTSKITITVGKYFAENSKLVFSNHELERAVEIGFDIISRNPLVEEAYFLLMKIFASMNNRLFVHQQYQQLKEVLNKELNEEPNQSITYWYNQWKENRGYLKDKFSISPIRNMKGYASSFIGFTMDLESSSIKLL